jgi:hypothetical protein
MAEHDASTPVFGELYADQNERDFAALRTAVAGRRVEAAEGM